MSAERSQHTPGPWMVSDILDNGNLGIVTDCSESQIIIGVPNKLREEDLNLIAAVPELLKAAQLTVMHFQRRDASDEFQGDDEHEAWGALNRAIAKAEGRWTRPITRAEIDAAMAEGKKAE